MEIINALGRRKTAVARVYLSKGKGTISINKKAMAVMFPIDVKVNVMGGGINGQAEAIRLGISRALVEISADYKPLLKADGLMTRDPRMVERKKPGQPKARKKFQFSKR